MSFADAALLLKWASETGMAKWEIHRRFGLKQSLWWKFMPGVVIDVKWPNGLVTHEYQDGSKVEFLSSDPNDHYRKWLEKNVGKQGWDWDWKSNVVEDQLSIKIRHKYKEHAIIAKLKWS